MQLLRVGSGAGAGIFLTAGLTVALDHEEDSPLTYVVLFGLSGLFILGVVATTIAIERGKQRAAPQDEPSRRESGRRRPSQSPTVERASGVSDVGFAMEGRKDRLVKGTPGKMPRAVHVRSPRDTIVRASELPKRVRRRGRRLLLVKSFVPGGMYVDEYRSDIYVRAELSYETDPDEAEARALSGRIAGAISRFLEDCEEHKPRGAALRPSSTGLEWEAARNQYEEAVSRHADRAVERAKDKFGEQVRQAYDALDAHGLAGDLDRFKLEHPITIADLQEIAEQLAGAADTSGEHGLDAAKTHARLIGELNRSQATVTRALREGRWWDVRSTGLQSTEWQDARDLLAKHAPSLYDTVQRAYALADQLNTWANEDATTFGPAGRLSRGEMWAELKGFPEASHLAVVALRGY